MTTQALDAHATLASHDSVREEHLVRHARPTRAAQRPVRVGMLFHGQEQYGLPTLASHTLEAHDRTRVRPMGAFFHRGEGFSLLAPLMHAAECFELPPLYALEQNRRHRLDPRYIGGRLSTLGRAALRTVNWVQRVRPAIVHVHEPSMLGVAFAATRGTGVRRLWQMQGAYAMGGIRRSRPYVRWMDNAVDRIVAVSEFVRLTLPRELQDRAVTVHNGVPIERLCRQVERGAFRKQYGVGSDQPLVGIFSAIVPVKGHEYFVEGAALALREVPDARFAIVGGTFPNFQFVLDRMKEQIRTLGIENSVIQTGFVPNARRFMADFDVIVMPTIFTPDCAGEGFSNVIIEAMAMGVPVIATDCGGSPEAFTHGVEGLLVPPKNGAALGEAMVRMLKDSAERKRMAKASWELARTRFEARLNASRMETIYEELVAR